MTNELTIHSPDEETKAAFERAMEELPDAMARDDFAALFVDVLRRYEMSGSECAEVAMILLSAISVFYEDAGVTVVRVPHESAPVH